MKKELNPVVVYVIIGVVVVVVLGLGYTMFGPKPVNYEKAGSEQMMQKVQSGGKMYEPPGKIETGADGKPKAFTPPGR